ncbi:MAG: hypothetical protein HQK55_17520 [Deltaproteobacteria bacterium]|nr:hypothetical protein [Deltaproteobacteria bacterium]
MAKRSLLLTARCLTTEIIEYCRHLPLNIIFDKTICVHGFPPDSPIVYLSETTEPELIWTFRNMDKEICFLGHTHLLEIIEYDGENISRHRPQSGTVELAVGKQYLINVGSVGQPRDSNKNAKYVIWDDSQRLLEIRFVPYDNHVTIRKIMDLGWPEAHARRLR